MKRSSEELGVPFYELFASLVVQRRYEDIMQKDKLINFKERLGIQNISNSELSNKKLRSDAARFIP